MNSTLTRRAFTLLGASALIRSRISPADRRPNFIVILTDDLGWTDLHCYGSEFYQTPNIDRVAAEGVKFTQAYSACTVCSPSRAAILTGRYPARLHVTDWIAGHSYPWAKLKIPDWTMHLPLEEVTIAERLKSAGYATASIGKWHLGGPEFYPEKQGFDRNVAGTDKGSPRSYFSPYSIPTLPDGPPGEYLTDRECTEALNFIDANKDRPFFLYMPHYAVHNPVQAKPDVVKRYTARIREGGLHNKADYAALIESVDDSAGRLMRRLRDLRIDDNTIIMFTSDNGGLLRNTSNVPLRAGKGSAYEGGVRVPLIVRWPNRVKAGSTCDVPVMGIDFAPTMLGMAGIQQDATGFDGESIVPLLEGGRTLKRDTLYWHYPHYHSEGTGPYSAIRERDLRLVEFHEDQRIELYDLSKDIGETRDLSGSMRERALQLRAKLHRWRENVGAQMPSPNPDYDPAKARQQRPPAPAKI